MIQLASKDRIGNLIDFFIGSFSIRDLRFGFTTITGFLRHAIDDLTFTRRTNYYGETKLVKVILGIRRLFDYI